MSTNWFALQNGSDIRGIAVDGVVGESVNLTPEIVKTIAIAFVKWLSAKTGMEPEYLKIAVGRDSRISGPALMDAFVDGLVKSGATAIECGIASTPAMYMSTVLDEMKYDGSAMLTASHLPFNRNGIKFFTNDGGLDKPDIKAILETASSITEIPAKTGNIESFDLISAYSAFLVDKIRKGVNHPTAYETPLAGFRIVVDAGNGAGGFFADKVLKPLGADTTGSQFLDPDGTFPNHVPNPEDETAMAFIQKAVVANKADLGIIFDTDVDRAAAVDQQGNNINRNTLIALIGSIVLDEHPGSTIVTDSITSDGLTDFIEKDLKGKHHRFKRGYKNVINEAIRLNNEGTESWLAIETSGHAALKENFFLDDGAYLITKILVKAAKMRMDGGKTVLDITSKLRQPVESKEFRVKILDPDFKAVGEQVISDLNDFTDLVMSWGWKSVRNNYEGIRVKVDSSAGDGWFLLRLSLHDPVIPLNIESNKVGGVKQIATVLDKFFEQFENLDYTSVSKFAK